MSGSFFATSWLCTSDAMALFEQRNQSEKQHHHVSFEV